MRAFNLTKQPDFYKAVRVGHSDEIYLLFLDPLSHSSGPTCAIERKNKKPRYAFWIPDA